MPRVKRAIKPVKFPDMLFVRQDIDGEDTFYISEGEPNELVEGDGPTPLAVYKLYDTQYYVRIVQPGRKEG